MTSFQLLYQQIHTSPAQRVPSDRIDHALGRLWEAVRTEVSKTDALTRACMSNLIIYCDSRAQADTVKGELPFVLQTHPARVLLLCGEPESADRDLVCQVSVHYGRLSHGWQVCGEQIEMSCAGDVANRLSSLARSLLIGDLPTALWWASDQPPPLAGEIFTRLAEIVDQIIFDSIGWRDPPRGMLAVARWVAGSQGRQVTYNLAWRRLWAWRKLLGESLDPAIAGPALCAVRQVEIEHGPHAMPIAWLLVGWLAERLHWQPVSGRLLSATAAHWRFDVGGTPIDVELRRREEGEPLLYLLTWSWHDTEHGSLNFYPCGERKLAVRQDDYHPHESVVSAPEAERAVLVAAQLAHRDRAKPFEAALRIAAEMATDLYR